MIRLNGVVVNLVNYSAKSGVSIKTEVQGHAQIANVWWVAHHSDKAANVGPIDKKKRFLFDL